MFLRLLLFMLYVEERMLILIEKKRRKSLKIIWKVISLNYLMVDVSRVDLSLSISLKKV